MEPAGAAPRRNLCLGTDSPKSRKKTIKTKNTEIISAPRADIPTILTVIGRRGRTFKKGEVSLDIISVAGCQLLYELCDGFARQAGHSPTAPAGRALRCGHDCPGRPYHDCHGG